VTALQKYFWPEKIAAQVMLVMVSSLILITAFVFVFFALLRPSPPHASAMSEMIMLGGTVQTLNQTSAADRAAVVAAINAANPHYQVSLVEPGEPLLGVPTQRLRHPIDTADLHDGMRLLGAQPFGPERELVAEIALADGTRVRAEHLAMRGKPLFFKNAYLLVVFFLALSLALLMIWALRTLVRPLSELERAVSVFGEGAAEPVPLVEKGPQEVRAAFVAFNRMQVRIRDLIDRRTRMLAAIGHDLRTPLTRLRLRLELMPEGDQKMRNLSDLAVMESQINGALTFLREGRTGERTGPVDLPSLLLSVQDQYEDMGVAMGLTCAPGLVVNGRASELVRAVSNLIDNAYRHAGHFELNARGTETHVEVEVTDHGPGLSEAEKVRLIEPFERGDAARSMTDGQGMGFGLGLATARAIAEGHGGRIELSDTPGGGLTVRLHLPRA
jgi:signal transduction histidine kinase